MNKQILDVILIILVLGVLVTTIVLIVIFDKDGFSCLSNPIDYYEDMKNVSCKCVPNELPYIFGEINFSDLE